MGTDYQPAGFCPKCGYRIDPGTCPECGRQVKRPWRLHPRVVRRYRRLAILLVFVALGFAGWRYGPDFAARHAPSSVLVWIWETDLAGAEWAEPLLRSRYDAAFPTGGYAARQTRDEFARRATEVADEDWSGHYSHAMLWLLGGRQLSLTDTEYLWHFAGAMQPGPISTGEINSFEGETLRLRLPIDRTLARWGRHDRFHQWLDSKFTLIRWGDWRYLVAEEELIDFCNDVNAGEPLDEFHLTRSPPYVTDVREFPGRPCPDDPLYLPTPYDRFILHHPVEFTVVAAQPRTLPTRGNLARLAKVTKGVGGLDLQLFDLKIATDSTLPLFVGMRLYSPDRLGMAHITHVEPQSCDARYVEVFAPGAQAMLVVGSHLSSIAPRPISIKPKSRRGGSPRPVRALFGLPPVSLSIADWPTDPFEIAKLRRGVEPEDWLLLEAARELRK